MKHRKLRIAVAIALVVGAACAYYFIGWHIYVKSAKAAFPRFPVEDCYYFPWPVGPILLGQLQPDDPLYLERDTVNRNSQGWLKNFRFGRPI
jgi:hypothetical protein